jgi:hypothetical protein
MRRPGERRWQVSTVVDGPVAEDIASRVTSGEVVPLVSRAAVSRAAWLATGSGGVGTVTTHNTLDHPPSLRLPQSRGRSSHRHAHLQTRQREAPLPQLRHPHVEQ